MIRIDLYEGMTISPSTGKTGHPMVAEIFVAEKMPRTAKRDRIGAVIQDDFPTILRYLAERYEVDGSFDKLKEDIIRLEAQNR